MTPLLYKPDKPPPPPPPQLLGLTADMLDGSMELLDGINGGTTLLRPTVHLSPVQNGQGVCGLDLAKLMRPFLAAPVSCLS